MIGIGGFFTLQSIKSNNSNKPVSSTENNNSSTEANNNNNTEKKSASFDDLKFTCDFDNNANGSEKSAFIKIENNSDSTFNGKINLNFTDSSNNTTNTMEVPIYNLMPKSSYSPNIIVNNSASNANYSFSGSFDSTQGNTPAYTVKKTLIGNNSYLFDVSVQDTSSSNLQQISDEFSKKYPSSVCNNFLIYFYPSDKGDQFNLNDAIGDFSRDYSDNTSKLNTYN